MLEVVSKPYEDSSPVFYAKDDPFVVRFKVKPLVWLPLDRAIPIHDRQVWETLSFTRGHEQTTSSWTGVVRVSLREISSDDSTFLRRRLEQQGSSDATPYPISDHDARKLQVATIRRGDNTEVVVSVPEDSADNEESEVGVRPPAESKRIQALLAQIGERMGFRVWLPPSDRSRVASYWQPQEGTLLDHLPLNYDETTIKTIEQIDVIWLKGRSIARAFEVEHTTSIYSGILRMADLMALQPNIDIKAHIVAPPERRDKVLEEIARPVFTLLEKGPLANSCTFISYDSLEDLFRQRHLEHMTDGVIDEYAEEAEV